MVISEVGLRNSKAERRTSTEGGDCAIGVHKVVDLADGDKLQRTLHMMKHGNEKVSPETAEMREQWFEKWKKWEQAKQSKTKTSLADRSYNEPWAPSGPGMLNGLGMGLEVTNHGREKEVSFCTVCAGQHGPGMDDSNTNSALTFLDATLDTAPVLSGRRR